jgi:hypothetical protein
MPCKFNAGRRRIIAKQKFKVTNWLVRYENPHRRGELTGWISDGTLSLWSGGEIFESGDYAMSAFARNPRPDAQYHNIDGLGEFGTGIPLSRRSNEFALPSTKSVARMLGPAHLVPGSRGLKIFGAGEWPRKEHRIKVKCKRWRKLHLGLDLVSGQIDCFVIVYNAGDSGDLIDLLHQIGSPVDSLLPMAPVTERQPVIFLRYALA